MRWTSRRLALFQTGRLLARVPPRALKISGAGYNGRSATGFRGAKRRSVQSRDALGSRQDLNCPCQLNERVGMATLHQTAMPVN
ncbi:unnamed protein product [Protopolystoma xenopodis]|uniref:Uncharacterized protein n=1 Tax=Protopolystoma xenopodis TaxID=117903 RepID=A0A3S5AE67_9PLAT|nr:unnamed protein product [Protopolystoma xenopodis]